jgi:hypothetical protein
MSTNAKFLLSLVCLSVFSLEAAPSCRPLNSFEAGDSLRQRQMQPGYNASARTDVRGSWNLYANGSYLFWQPCEENLEFGLANNSLSAPYHGAISNLDFHYKSGLQAGLGVFFNYDNWDFSTQYTWLSGTTHGYLNSPQNGDITPLFGSISGMLPTSAASAREKWKLELNIANALLARDYYVGNRLTLKPSFGARAAWINQMLSTTYYSFGGVPFNIRSSTHSWGVGLEAGLESAWLFGYGFHLLGSIEADTLFTRYNMHQIERQNLDPAIVVASLRQKSIYYLRPHVDFEFGLGWGGYFDNHNYHFGLLASYGFQTFWNQNMFHNLNNTGATVQNTPPSGDLYIHGLKTQVQLDF